MSQDYRKIIKRPMLTEKVARLQGDAFEAKLAGKGEWYAFEVDPKANKISIKRAVEELYAAQKINVQKVRTMNCRGRQSRTGQTLSGVAYWKKALVQLAEGQSIAPQQ